MLTFFNAINIFLSIFFSDYGGRIACLDENNEFVEIGKVGTGIKEKDEEGVTFEQLTELLKPLILSQDNYIPISIFFEK